MYAMRMKLAGAAVALGVYLASAVGAAHAQELRMVPPIEKLFTERCLECHGNPRTKGGVKVLDIANLTKKVVVPGRASDSELFKRITLKEDDVDRMPPPEHDKTNQKLAPLTRAEVEMVRAWIEGKLIAAAVPGPGPGPGGAPSDLPKDTLPPINPPALPDVGAVTPPEDVLLKKPLNAEYVLRAIAADQSRLGLQQRREARYFSLAHLVAAGIKADELNIHRQALSKALNHLHWKSQLVQPTAVEREQVVFRINLRDVGWDREVLRNGQSAMNLWDLMLLDYPFGVAQTGSATYQGLAQTYFQAAGMIKPVAYVRGDWFVAAATQPPLYHELLNLPRTLDSFERTMMGTTAESRIRAGQAVRAGVTESGVSQNYRVIERHTMSNGRMYWRSYDYAQNTNKQNITRDPVNLQPDGGEMIFELNNGLQGYLVFNGQGQRVDFAPTNIVVDKDAKDKTVRNGLACMRCHQDGMRSCKDVIRTQVLNQGASPIFDRASALALYPGEQTVNRLLDADGKRFQKAMEQLFGQPQKEEPLTPVARKYLDERITLETAVAELGRANPTGMAEIFKLPQFSDLAQLGTGGKVARDVWDNNFDLVAQQLGLGVPLSPLDGLARANYEPPQRPFRFTAQLNKNVFKDGDNLEVHMLGDRSLFVEIAHTSSSGKVTMLTPTNARLSANSQSRVPSKGKTPHKITRPRGVPDEAVLPEHVTVLVSDQPIGTGERLDGFGVTGRVVRRAEISADGRQVNTGLDASRIIKMTLPLQVK